MGRIADALRRAALERRQTMESAVGRRSSLPPHATGATATLPPSLDTPPGPSPSIEPAPPDDGSEPSKPQSLVEGLSDSLIPFFEQSSLITEQYRALRTRLLSQNQHYEHRILAVTSAIPKEGKSVTTLNLGCTLAEIKHLKVLVVDGDFRRSSLARMLDQPKGPGLAEVLRGKAQYEDVLRDTPIANLKFIPAGDSGDQSPAELLTATVMGQIFQRVKNEFHYTIVDTPPATTVTDVGIIGQMCSGVIMLVRLHRTAEVAAKRAVRLLQVNNIPIVGCLVIGRDAPSGRYGYGYGYGYAYNYYRYYDYYKKSGDKK